MTYSKHRNKNKKKLQKKYKKIPLNIKLFKTKERKKCLLTAKFKET